jgi:hypothetical protein
LSSFAFAEGETTDAAAGNTDAAATAPAEHTGHATKHKEHKGHKKAKKAKHTEPAAE